MESIKAPELEQVWFHLNLYKWLWAWKRDGETEQGRGRARVCMLTHMYAASITSANECVRLCMRVPIPFHLIKPWLQQPHTLVCRTQPFITGLEPFTTGFMGASAGPQGHHSRGDEEGEQGRWERRNERPERRGVKMEGTPLGEGE